MHAIEGLNTRYNRSIVEQALIVGALDAEAISDPDQAEKLSQRVARRLDRMADDVEQGWQGAPDGADGPTADSG